MSDVLAPRNNFHSLSVKDLLEARDLYHYHLMNKPNVVGTAIGLYLIRKSDPWPTDRQSERDIATAHRLRKREERRFDNSEVRGYSWPCVLALVKNWAAEEEFSGRSGELRPEQMVPKTLYLPDGRMVPVCVVKVERAEPAPDRGPVDWHWPKGLYGGGMPIVVEAQGCERRATAGCLVTDGHTLYAVTSRHVCGAPGSPVYTLAAGRRVQIGRASRQQRARVAFTDVYAGFASRQTFVNLDVGLVEVEDVNSWTSQIYGLGPCGELADLNEMSISTRLIDAPVVAMGAASGRLEGRIKALFYRYRAVGGYDYVADFLIAPRDADAGEDPASIAQSRPGDSGTVWHLVVSPDANDGGTPRSPADDFTGDLRPLAVQWGGQVFSDRSAAGGFAFAVATSMTTVCRLLNVELVVDHAVGVRPYWGTSGHYGIAALACDLVRAPALQRLMRRNVARISFAAGSLDPKQITAALATARAEDGLVPLADVPDIVWKQLATRHHGGRDTAFAGPGRSTGPEHPAHYADIDEARPSDGKTLRELSLEHDASLSVDTWRAFYDETGHTESRDRGLLPFRVWQFFDEMRRAADTGDVPRYVCAAGILAHYVADACQPLHGSVLADGYKDQPKTETHHDRETGEAYTKSSNVGAGVHSLYESKMIDRYLPDILARVRDAVPNDAVPPVVTGRDAARATVALMDRTARRLPPAAIVDAYVAAGDTPNAAARDALWEQFGDDTIGVMADGARVLAMIWDAAWAAGNGDAIAADALREVSASALQRLYADDPHFVPSLDLDAIGPILEQPDGAAG